MCEQVTTRLPRCSTQLLLKRTVDTRTTKRGSIIIHWGPVGVLCYAQRREVHQREEIGCCEWKKKKSNIRRCRVTRETHSFAHSIFLVNPFRFFFFIFAHLPLSPQKQWRPHTIATYRRNNGSHRSIFEQKKLTFLRIFFNLARRS